MKEDENQVSCESCGIVIEVPLDVWARYAVWSSWTCKKCRDRKLETQKVFDDLLDVKLKLIKETKNGKA